ncbi:hypothetical protein ACLOJK_020366 [Asimina triloba]
MFRAATGWERRAAVGWERCEFYSYAPLPSLSHSNSLSRSKVAPSFSIFQLLLTSIFCSWILQLLLTSIFCSWIRHGLLQLDSKRFAPTPLHRPPSTSRTSASPSIDVEDLYIALHRRRPRHLSSH